MDEYSEAPQRVPFSNLIQHPEVPHFFKTKAQDPLCRFKVFIRLQSRLTHWPDAMAWRHATWIWPSKFDCRCGCSLPTSIPLLNAARVDILEELISKIIQHNVVPAVIFHTVPLHQWVACHYRTDAMALHPSQHKPAISGSTQMVGLCHQSSLPRLEIQSTRSTCFSKIFCHWVFCCGKTRHSSTDSQQKSERINRLSWSDRSRLQWFWVRHAFSCLSSPFWNKSAPICLLLRQRKHRWEAKTLQ